MRRRPGTLARIRPLAGPLLLTVFMVAAQLAPARHLAAHRDDHTHGPEPASSLAAVHDAEPHEHEHDEDGDHDHGGAAPAAPHRHSTEHGQSSAAHFGLALIQGPPPPFLPPPAATLAPPPVAVLLGRFAVPRRQPPARGPPRLI